MHIDIIKKNFNLRSWKRCPFNFPESDLVRRTEPVPAVQAI